MLAQTFTKFNAMLILKFFHVLFIFIWMGSLLMLTRLLAYMAKEPEPTFEALNRINRRMYLFIDLPAMVLSVIFGIILLMLKEMNWKAPWLHLKLTFAFCLICCDCICGAIILKGRRPSRIGCQIFHGMTGLFLIVVLVAIYILKQRA